jgi:protein N-terminal asparagine amidohydrolase
MVVVLPGGPVRPEELPPDSRTLFMNHPCYKDSAAQLLAISPKVVGHMGLLYVHQRELAVTVPHDSTNIFYCIFQLQATLLFLSLTIVLSK